MKALPLTKDLVKDQAISLIKACAHTTTLEVKLTLRNRGYYATQEEVSQYMNELFQDGEFLFTQGQGHREYYLPASNESHVVWDKNDPSSTFVIVAKGRQAARNQYANMFNVPYRDTRSKRQ